LFDGSIYITERSGTFGFFLYEQRTLSNSLVFPVSTCPRIQQMGLRRSSLFCAATAASWAFALRSAASAFLCAAIFCVCVSSSDDDSSSESSSDSDSEEFSSDSSSDSDDRSTGCLEVTVFERGCVCRAFLVGVDSLDKSLGNTFTDSASVY